MEEGEQELQSGPEVYVITYRRAIVCEKCGGVGTLALLVTARPCGECAGSGRIWPEPQYERTPPQMGYWRYEEIFDDSGDLLFHMQRFEPAVERDEERKGK